MSALPPGEATILLAPTPAAWVDDAAAHWQELLVDHANCEKKAASSALALLFAYPEDRALALAVARVAREELRHFEQVLRMQRTLGVSGTRQRPGRYAAQLHRALRRQEPGRKLDLLLVAALIEARSAERFALLAPRLAMPLAGLYRDLLAAEERHRALYLDFARDVDAAAWSARLRTLAATEAELATTPEACLRFHSGPLAAPARR